MAKSVDNESWLIDSKISLLYTYTVTGLFTPAASIIKELRNKEIPGDELKARFYRTCWYYYTQYKEYNKPGFKKGEDLYRQKTIETMDKADKDYYFLNYFALQDTTDVLENELLECFNKPLNGGYSHVSYILGKINQHKIGRASCRERVYVLV